MASTLCQGFYSLRKQPFLLALRRCDVSRGCLRAKRPLRRKTKEKRLFSQATEWSEKYLLSRNRDGLKQNEQGRSHLTGFYSLQKNPSKAKYYNHSSSLETVAILNLRTAAALFLIQTQIDLDTCSFFGVNRHLNMYSKPCSAQWLHVYVAKIKVFCSIPSGKWLENPPLRVRNPRWKTSNVTSNTYHMVSSRLPVVSTKNVKLIT